MLLCSGEEPTMNEWPQRMMGEQRSMLMMPSTNNSTTSSSSSGGGGAVMERPTPQGGGGGHQTPLKCPRCDSSNTKFCYYNNYSLSQPRHFCKACKRYWTRGGTLRNVPVGGGCRKNKRVKKNQSSVTSAVAAAATTTSSVLLAPPQNINSSGQMNTDMNPPFFYDLTGLTGYHTLRHPTSACGVQNGGIYDLQPQMNALGLGFSQNQHHNSNNNDEYQSTGYGANPALFQQSASSALLQDYPLFGSAASLLPLSFKQTKKADEYPSSLLPHYEDTRGSAGRNVELMDQQVKLEGDLDINGNWQLSCNNTFDAAAASAGPNDLSFMYWNPVASGGWPDANNCGSSIAPLI